MSRWNAIPSKTVPSKTALQKQPDFGLFRMSSLALHLSAYTPTRLLTLVLSTFIVFHLMGGNAFGEVYRWVDQHGKEHFSTTPVPGAKTPSKLPEIKRENFAERIKQIKENTPQNCESHGGFDCAKGADSDGSVICLDGYRDSVMSFLSLCSEARLRVGKVQFMNGEGKPLALREKPAIESVTHATFTVRNLTGIEAKGVTAELSFPRPSRRLPVSGPTTVDPYGIAEYNAVLIGAQPPLNIEKLKGVRVRIKCDRCQVFVGAN